MKYQHNLYTAEKYI